MSVNKQQLVAGLILSGVAGFSYAEADQANAQLDCVRACLTPSDAEAAAVVPATENSTAQPAVITTQPEPQPASFTPGHSAHRLTVGASATTFTGDELDTATGGFTLSLFTHFNDYFYSNFEIIAEGGTVDVGDTGNADVDHLYTSAEFGGTVNQWGIDWGAGISYVQRDIDLAIPNDAIITDSDEGVGLHLWGLGYLGPFGIQFGTEINGALSSTAFRGKVISPEIFGFRGQLEARVFADQIMGSASVTYYY